ncbi:TPR end-of-group domain-containing protein [Vulgatibacter sp.]|uniref:TPR end-of-group domain-containing protein n=1 Tax=Vulgatibacter sp. TaxID=1971226 RepID=UPI003565B37D
MGAIALAALLVSLPLGCAHGPSADPGDEPVIHQRIALQDDGLVEIELLDAEGAPPRLGVRRLGRCGPAEAEGVDPATAREVAAAVRKGTPLEAALPGALAGEAPPWRPTLLVGAYRLETRTAADRYGSHLQVVLVGKGDDAVEVARTGEGVEVMLAPAGEGAALLGIEGPGTRRDVRVIDVEAAARRLHVERGERLLAAGRHEAARAEIAAASQLAPCGPDGALPWLESRVLAAQGAPAAAILDALEEAIAADPTLYRMYARTAPELAPLRDEPRFVELTRPRPLSR